MLLVGFEDDASKANGIGEPKMASNFENGTCSSKMASQFENGLPVQKYPPSSRMPLTQFENENGLQIRERPSISKILLSIDDKALV